MSAKASDVLIINQNGGNRSHEMIDSAELAARWQVPESWIRNRTRARTLEEERIHCVRFECYVRFEWDSAQLAEWLAKKRF